MSNASPLREPSMDEILASIRRIIESGDETPPRDSAEKSKAPSRIAAIDPIRSDAPAGRKPLPEARVKLPQFDVAYASTVVGRAPFRDASTYPDADASHHAGGEAVSDRASTAAATASVGKPEADAADRSDPRIGEGMNDSFALRATVAKLREDEATSSEDDEPVWTRRDVGNQNIDAASLDGPDDAAAQASGASFAFEFDEAEFAAELQRDAGLEQESPMAVTAQNNVAELFEEPPVEPHAASANSVIATASALLSEQAGEQVATAFDNLALAIREGQMRSMEGMAREMLRPMLQEWLDDNLPQIVERLVRDEIERVARGPRR